MSLLLSLPPEVSDKDIPLYLALRDALATGRGLPYKRPKPATVPDQWSYLKGGPAPLISGATTNFVRPGLLHSREIVPSNAARTVVYETHRGQETDEYGYVLPFEVGSEVVISAYRDHVRQLEALAKRRFVQGYRLPENRFRSFSTEPYFPDVCGGINHAYRDATRHHSYQLGEGIPGSLVIVQLK